MSTEMQDTTARTLPSHPVELGDSDIDNSRSVSPDVHQLRSEARDTPSAAHHGLHTGQQQTGTTSQYGEGYTSDGIPPPLSIPGEYSSTSSGPNTSSTEQHTSSLQEAVPAATDRGIADSNTTAEPDSAVPSSPVSPSKSESRGFFSRVLGSFMPGASSEAGSETGNTSTTQARYLQTAPSATWGKPTETANIDTVKEQGLEKAAETGLDPATATKLAGLDSAAAYNKHEPAVAAAEVLEENKADARQDTAAAGGLTQREPHSPGHESEVYATPQTSPGHHSTGTGYGQSYGQGDAQGAQTDSHADSNNNQGVVGRLASAVGLGGASAQSESPRRDHEQYSAAVPHNMGSSQRSTSFENRPVSGEGWTQYRSPEKGTGASYGQSQQPSGDSQYDSVTGSSVERGATSGSQAYGNESRGRYDGQSQQSYGSDSDRRHGGESEQRFGNESRQGYSSQPDNRYAGGLGATSAPAQQHEQYGSQSSTGTGHRQGAQTDAYADNSSSQGIGSKLASAVGLGGNSAQQDQYGSQSSTGTGYKQGAQTDAYADNSSSQGIGSKVASAVGLGGNSAQQEQYSSQSSTGTGYGQGYGQGAQTDSYANTGGSSQGVGSKLASAVGLSGASQETTTQTGTVPGVTRTLSNLPPSASWGKAAHTTYQPGQTTTTGSSYTPASVTGSGYTPASVTSTGYTSGAATGSTATDGHADSSKNQGVVGKLAGAVGMGSSQETTGHKGSSSNSDRATGTGTGTGAHTSASTVGERLTEPVHKGTDSTTAAYTDAGRHETPVEQSAQAFTDEAAPATAAQTKHTPSIGTTAHEHASSPRNASNKPTAFSTGAGTGAGADFGSSTGTSIGLGTGAGTGAGTGLSVDTSKGTGAQSQTTESAQPPVSFGTTAAEHALSRTSGTPLSRSSAESLPPTSGKKLAATPEASSAAGQPSSAMGTTAAEHALRRTSGTPLARTSGASTNPPTSSQHLPTATDTGTGNARSTSDLPVSSNAPPASARTTQEDPATTTAAKTEGTNGTAIPSTGTSTAAAKPTAASTASGIGSQGKPAVPAQPSKSQTGKKNGVLACFTCGQKSTVE